MSYTITAEMQSIIAQQAKRAKISQAKVSAIVAECLALIPQQKAVRGRSKGQDTLAVENYFSSVQSGESFTAKELAEKLGLKNPATVNNACRALMSEGKIVISGYAEKTGRGPKPAIFKIL